jgi:glycosyltransferase involved in cell wall biosynthesis
MSDQVWAFSEPLKAKISSVRERVVVPPAIASIENIEALLSPRTGEPSVPVIGYAGSRYHARDVDEIAPALLRLLEEFPTLEMEFVDAKPETLAAHPRVRHFPKLDGLDRYYAFVSKRNWTAGIAPLRRSADNDAKTDNKYREYAALGVPGVYADAPPYWGSVIDGFNGLVAHDLDDWYARLRTLIGDSRMRADIAANARADVYKRYGLQRVAERYLNLIRSAVNPALKVLVHAAAIPTTDIDIVRPLRRLAEEGAVDFEIVPYRASASNSQLADADVLVISRVHDASVLKLFREAKSRHGLPVVFSWDDDFFAIPESLGDLARHHRHPEIIAGLETLLSEADLVKASTPLIEKRTRQYTDRVVRMPYGFDFSQVRGTSSQRAKSDSSVVIGFFGTVSHAAALEGLVAALKIIAKRNTETRFEFFGPRTPILESLPRATFIPYADSSEESIRTLATRGWDVGLAPLEINDFNRAKLPTKYRDYSACHIAGVYSRIDPYTDVVLEGTTGLLVDNERDQWVEALSRLVDDAALRRSIAANAHAHVRSELSLECAVEDWRGLLTRFARDSDSDTEALARARKRVELLRDEVAFLSGQLDSLRTASTALTQAYLQPLPPAATLGGRLRRYVLHKLTNLPGAAPIARVAVPPANASVRALAFAAGFAPGPHAGDGLRLSANLQQAAFLEYALPVVPHPVRIVKLAVAALVPCLDGLLGIEIVTPADTIHYHATLPCAQVDCSQIAVFRVPVMSSAEPGWRIRCFARGSVSPLHVYEVTTQPDRVLVLLEDDRDEDNTKQS